MTLQTNLKSNVLTPSIDNSSDMSITTPSNEPVKQTELQVHVNGTELINNLHRLLVTEKKNYNIVPMIKMPQNWTKRVNMKTLTIAALCFGTTGVVGSIVTSYKYITDSLVAQLFSMPVEILESSLVCARVVLGNASYRYGFVVDRGVCYGCRTRDLSWPLIPEETLLTGTPLVLGMLTKSTVNKMGAHYVKEAYVLDIGPILAMNKCLLSNNTATFCFLAFHFHTNKRSQRIIIRLT